MSATKNAPTVQEIAARWALGTRGPWVWSGNLSSHSINLMARHGWGDTVMAFRRWGMGGAQPAFNINGLLYRAFQGKDGQSLMIAPQAHNAWDIRGIDHPDAIKIAAAPTDIATLLTELARCEAALAAATDGLRTYADHANWDRLLRVTQGGAGWLWAANDDEGWGSAESTLLAVELLRRGFPGDQGGN